MSRPTTKQSLQEAAESQFAKLWQTIAAMPEDIKTIVFDFPATPSRKEAHWQRDKNIRDVLVHLYEWHLLLIHWLEGNLAGIDTEFLPKPYTWKTYGQMNVAIWRRHQSTSYEEAKELLLASHRQVMALIDGMDKQHLFVKKHYAWTGSTSVGTYCVSSTSSHYEWAIKKLKVHIKCCSV